MKERREFVRLDTRIDVAYVPVSSKDDKKKPKQSAKTPTPQQAQTKDIGGGGICFFSDKPLEEGTRLECAAKLPNQEEPLRFKVEVVWSDTYEVFGKGGKSHDATEVGAKFVEINPEDQETIMKFVILGMTPKKEK